MQVHTTIHGQIAQVRLDRPPANAMEPDFLHEIADCFDALDGNDDVKAIILTGTGRVFSAGVDLKQLAGLDIPAQDRLVLAINRMCASVYGTLKPVIGALNGHAIAGGLVLALACDYRVAAAGGSQFGLAEVRVGVPFPEAPFAVVEEQLPRAALRQLIQFGDPVDVGTAQAMGVIDEIVAPDELMARALEKAQASLAIPSQGYAEIKNQQRGAAIEKMRNLVKENRDKYLGGWINDEARTAAARLLGA